jgi:hypothetical protein
MSNNKQAQLIDGYWVVGTNKWNSNMYTQEQAEKNADTLVYCRGCSNCINCGYCSGCSDCRGCSNCSNCSNCSYCSNCSNCINCGYCSGCSGFKENPERITSPKIGSRHNHTTYYWTKEHEQIVCGCFIGTLDDFEKAVEQKHGDNQYGIEYKNWIQKVKLYKEK